MEEEGVFALMQGRTGQGTRAPEPGRGEMRVGSSLGWASSLHRRVNSPQETLDTGGPQVLPAGYWFREGRNPFRARCWLLLLSHQSSQR